MKRIRGWLAQALADRRPDARTDGLRGESGSALIEIALIISIFAPPLLFGTVDLATAIYASIEVSNAAHAGALYAMVSSTYAEDNSGIIAAAQAEATDFGANLTVTPTMYYACSNNQGGTQYTTQSLANSNCSGTNNHALQFVQVVVTAPVTPAFRFSGLPATFTLTGTSVIEVEE